MSSAGQIIGGIAGAAIGFFVGNPILGAQIGMMVGSAIDPPKGPSITGPRLEDLSVQTATYGAPLPRGYGTVCVSGNIFWLENDQLKEWTTTEESGGKGGGGGGETTTYHYSATFAVGLMHVPAGATVSLRRLWIDTDLVYEAGSDNVESIIASNSGHGFLAGSRIWNEISTWWINALMTGQVWTFYDGSDDQLPNDRMQADKGAANVSAYPGLCYIVFEDLSLEKYSNTLMRAQVKAELVISAALSTQSEKIAEVVVGDDAGGPDWGNRTIFLGTSLGPTGANYVAWQKYNHNGNPLQMYFGSIEYLVQSDVTAIDISGASWGYAHTLPKISQSDVLKGMAVSTTLTQNAFKFHFFTLAGISESHDWIVDSRLFYGPFVCAFYGEKAYLANVGSASYILQVNEGSVVLATGATFNVNALAASENYLFALHHAGTTGGTTTVYRFNRADLSLSNTFTQTARGGVGSIFVVDDDTFYTMGQEAITGNGMVYKWVGGVVVEAFGAVFPPVQTYSTFFVANDSPFYGVCQNNVADNGTHDFYMAHAIVPATPAKLRDIVTDECGLAGINPGDINLDGLINADVRGFRVAQRGAVRNSLEPLQAAWPFDVAQSGYFIRFVSRGGASVASIHETDLGANDGQPGVLLPVAREMDSQLPFRVSIRYTDPDREYDIGEQAVERFEKDSLNERVMELPLSLTSGEAIQMADVLLAKDWTERVEFGPFSLPPTWRHLEPADVVTVTHRGQDYTLRLTRVEYLPDGRLVCSARMNSAASYTSTASAQSPLVLGQSLVPLTGSTQGYLLDIPRIRSEQDVLGLVYGMTGLASGWPGATLLRSDDQGATYQALGSVNARLKVFDTGMALAAHHGYSIDAGSALIVTPRYSAHTLSGITEDQFYAHANLAAYGADGRWEILAFRGVVDNTGSYTLSAFMRGLYGSEWASGLHQDGDLFIMLDTATVSFFGLPSNALGAARLYRAVTQGALIESTADIVATCSAVNFKPLAPVDLNGNRDVTSFDWTLTWARRTRTPTELFSGVAVPLGETSESYDMELWDSGYTTLKRTFSGLTSPTVSYTQAQQIADFGGVVSTLYVKLFQNSATVGRGYPLTTSIYRALVADAFGDYVKLLMHWTSDLNDFKGHTVTAVGGAAVAGGYANFDGTGDCVMLDGAADLAPGTSDFTIEMLFTPLAMTEYHFLWDSRSGNGNYLCFYVQPDGSVVLFVNSSVVITSTTGLFSNGTEKHVALCRSGTNTRIFVGGSQVGIWTSDSTNYLNATSRPAIIANGADINNDAYKTYCKVREFRYTAAARYTANFTPPASPLPDPA